jgi:uncharacterized protein with HEPN domain
MNRDTTYLKAIREAAQAMVGYVRGNTRDFFVGDRMTRSAVLYEIVIIGEGWFEAHPSERTNERIH